MAMPSASVADSLSHKTPSPKPYTRAPLVDAHALVRRRGVQLLQRVDGPAGRGSAPGLQLRGGGVHGGEGPATRLDRQSELLPRRRRLVHGQRVVACGTARG